METNNEQVTKDIMNHKEKVLKYLNQIISNFTKRGISHDDSKLQSPEKEYYDKYSPEFWKTKYMSDEYKAIQAKMWPGIEHHITNNTHHPEAFEHGVKGMSFLDLMEMLADWKAASERNNATSFIEGMKINKDRWNISDDLYDAMINTVKELDW
jgi:hypothetical protein